jgi:Ser/Thr protein kinase RdoA (MazF antagonist)
VTPVASAGIRPADHALRSALERALEGFFGRPRPITRMTRTPSACRSSFALENVDLEFSTGDHLQVVFKNLSPGALSSAGRTAKPPFLLDPSREIRVYRTILGPYGIGAPTCYGAVLDRVDHRYWLFLERAPGMELYQFGEIEVWRRVARWLAVTHATLARDASELADGGSLLRYDAGYYETWARRAAAALATSGSDLDATKASRLLAWTRERHPRLVTRLLELPHTVIHGEFYAANILVQPDGPAAPVRALDWETTAIGPALVDLAALTSGKWAEPERTAIAHAYWEQATGSAATPFVAWPSFERFADWVELCRLHLAVQWLGWSRSWTPPAHQLHDWMSEALLLIERVRL